MKPLFFIIKLLKVVLECLILMMMEKNLLKVIFVMGQSFGEPPLFIDEKYPSTATAFQDSKIIKLSKDKFLKI
jgi:CRP-like cAMP-binding protein